MLRKQRVKNGEEILYLGNKFKQQRLKYVYYGIDYSPSRASKLNREIKVSNDKKQIEKIFQDEIESNVKKGWNKF